MSLEEKAGLGIEAEDFLTGPLGEYLRERSDNEEMAALTELGRVNPHETIKIIELQTKAQVAVKALDWLRDAIREGRAAVHALEQETFSD